MITNVNSATTTNTSAADASMKQTAGLNKDDFLKLFITQLQNQDPLNPQDSTQFLSQLAQLTQVEQAYNTNSNLSNLLSQGNNSTTLAAVSLVGKSVEANGTQVNLTAGSPTAVNYYLASSAANVSVSITDSTGAVVKTLTGGSTAAGKGSVSWDGTTNGGATAAAGVYNVAVTATDAAGNNITATPFVKGSVNSVDMTGTVPTVYVGPIAVSLTDVTSVGG
ncbi:flagellar hook assembly protein FlgD [Geomesophilobacter sediminis]|uniref:Basal-body rod modification protein FlgD n=1 Tax=Geomesophilobacter sediminis TaxID=2798584 RepID=A0A8J7LVA6_9BACT|nr:flagellar hook capping FlgD N-terminal domain-containing protein [Geomesophilobacter sediminis]MBJ6724750.1 flagellar hook assembly protein FlgD [Geomesophilobacter sediminis]